MSLKNIVLQPHQRSIRNHMAEKCAKQPGIVLYHAVGTGKTYTALSVTMAFPDIPCTVFCPEELVFMWKSELQKIGSPRHIVLKVLDDMPTHHVDGGLVIVDEVHFWIQWLMSKHETDRKKAENAFQNLAKAKRRILLTGSPIVSPIRGIYDVACLYNLAVGHEHFPFSQPAFKKMFTYTKRVQSAILGWFFPAILPVIKNLFVVTSFAFGTIKYIDNKFPTDFTTIEASKNELRNKFKNKSKENNNYPWKLQHRMDILGLTDPANLVHYIHPPPDGTKNAGFRGGLPVDLHGFSEILKSNLKEKESKQEKITNKDKSFQQIVEKLSLFASRGLQHKRMYHYLVLSVLGPLLASLFINSKIQSSRVKGFDINRFWKEVKPVVSRFSITLSDDFPKSSIKKHVTPLTMSQQRKLWELSNRFLDPKDLQKLGIQSSQTEMAYESFISDYEDYLKTARRVGIHSDDIAKNPPPKFKTILKLMKKVDVKRCVVFSENKGTIDTFATFLDNEGIKYEKLSRTTKDKEGLLQKFKDGVIPVILLSPTMFFGFSIKGARQLHVMEPIFDGVTREQLYGRVIRYKSHEHLPPDQRKVDIYVHISTISKGIFQAMRRFFSVSLLQYFKHDASMYPGVASSLRNKRREKFEMSLETPDETVWKLNENIEKLGEHGIEDLGCPERWRRATKKA
jgi:hypothetical protein